MSLDHLKPPSLVKNANFKDKLSTSFNTSFYFIWLLNSVADSYKNEGWGCRKSKSEDCLGYRQHTLNVNESIAGWTSCRVLSRSGMGSVFVVALP